MQICIGVQLIIRFCKLEKIWKLVLLILIFYIAS